MRLKPLATTCRIQNEAGLAAFNAIETEFASKFEGCTLEEVRYDSEVETRHLDEMLEHGQKAKGTLSSCYPNSRPTGGQLTRAFRRTTDTKAGNGFSPGLRKTPHRRLSTGAIDGAAAMHHAALAPCEPAHVC